MANQKVLSIFDELIALHKAKDADYGGQDSLSNFYISETFGIPAWIGAAIRLSDKWSRFMSLMSKQSPEVVSETLDDTLKDLAVYAIIVLALRDLQTTSTHIPTPSDWALVGKELKNSIQEITHETN